jgi:hypothetical protein
MAFNCFLAPAPGGAYARGKEQVAGGVTVVYLGGRGPGRKPIRLHDPPPGYRRPGMSPKERQRKERQERILLRVATIILIPTAVVVVVIFIAIIATHH